MSDCAHQFDPNVIGGPCLVCGAPLAALLVRRLVPLAEQRAATDRDLLQRAAEALLMAAPVVRGCAVTPGWASAVRARPVVDGVLSAIEARLKETA